jgi:hypothetical protein
VHLAGRLLSPKPQDDKDQLSSVRLLLLLTVGCKRQRAAHYETYKAISFGKGRQEIMNLNVL